MPTQEYKDIVDRIESSLGPWAKKSFEPEKSSCFVDGGEYFRYFSDQWSRPETRARIETRTPLQIERDRILYSSGMRKLTEKYHVLYSGERRITRNFITHTMRMAQVARAICNGLRLNADFAEALSLGAKVGAPPFVHASKDIVAKWICEKLVALDKDEVAARGVSPVKNMQPNLDLIQSPDARVPNWLSGISSKRVQDNTYQYIPWSSGTGVLSPYSSGSQGYWSLSADPFLVQSRPNRFSPDTMFGIWRHGISDKLGPDSFIHRFELEGATTGVHIVTWQHVTYESLVVRYADDVTWVIENLADAHRASVLMGGPGVYKALDSELKDITLPAVLSDALRNQDSGGMYTYFISDFIQSAKAVLNDDNEGARNRMALTMGQPEAQIALSTTALTLLGKMKEFLLWRVFEEARVSNRFKILQTVTRACLELLHTRPEALDSHAEKQSVLADYKEGEKSLMRQHLKNEVHRIQLAADVFSQMSDQEIYDFVGIQGL